MYFHTGVSLPTPPNVHWCCDDLIWQVITWSFRIADDIPVLQLYCCGYTSNDGFIHR